MMHTHKIELKCPACQEPHKYATGQGPTPRPGDIIVCGTCYAVSQVRTPGPRLDRIDETLLDPQTKAEVETHIRILKEFKAERGIGSL